MSDTAPVIHRSMAQHVIRVVGVCGLLAILVVSMLGGSPPLSKGKPAPLTQGMTLDGGAFDLRAWQGQWVFVNVWATWCGPCLQELPDLAATAVKWPQVRFVGLAADSPRADIDVVAARFGLPYPVVPIDGALQLAWNANALPSSYLLAPDGTIAWSGVGALDARSLDGVLKQMASNTSQTIQSATTSP